MRLPAIKFPSVRRGLPLFLVVVVCLAIWQLWLTWRLMEQDRNLAARQSRERLEQISGLAAAQVAGILGGWALSLREWNTLPPPDSVKVSLPSGGTMVVLSHQSVTTYPVQGLLFVPDPPTAVEPLPAVFDTAETLEFRDRDYNRSIEVLRRLTEQPAARTEAWLRIARIERRLKRGDAALAAYARLQRETAINPDGVPYALLAAGALAELQPRERAVEHLRYALLEGRWPIRRETFEYYWSEVNRLRRAADVPPGHAMEFSLRVSRLYELWQRAVKTGASSSGREAGPDESLLMWHATPDRLLALSAPPGWLGESLKLPANTADIRWKWTATPSQTPASQASRPLAEAQIPGSLEFSSIAAPPKPGLSRPLWLAAVALMLSLVLTGAYAIHRGVSRELRVAQLQSDFVSAVSHEFRSPLTALRGITELLAEDRIDSESGRRQSHMFLARETARLQRLVEDLLDFGSMEAGRKQYSMEPHDVFGLVRAAVADFKEDPFEKNWEVEMNLESREATVHADGAAIRRAIRNLLENARKYSPDCRTVWVDGRVERRRVAISVRDRGMGIDPAEQREIFQKFVRGSTAKKAGIKGTGIGLSMVHQIVQSCGGEIRLESAVGSGSTFTLLFPLAGDRTETKA